MRRALSSSEHGMLRTGLNIVMVAELARRVEAEALRSAIDRVRPACPLLGARLGRVGRGRLEVHSDDEPPPLRVVDEAATWRPEALRELTHTFDAARQPLARFALLQGEESSTLITNTHHCVSDGLAGAWLVGELLAALADPGRRRPPAALPVAVDDLCPPGLLSGPLILALRAAGGVGALLGPASPVRTREKVPCDLLAWTLDEAETGRLVEACRRAGVTVHAALCGAFRLAEARVQGTRPRLSRVYTPVSVRARLTAPVGEAFGFYASEAMVPLHVRPSEDLPSVLRRADAAVRVHTSDRHVLRLLAMTGQTHPSFVDRMVAGIRARKGIRFGTAICNLGRVTLPEAGRPLLRDLYGPLPYLERAEKAVTVLTAGERMSFVLVWPRKTIADDVATDVRERAMALLRELAAPSSPIAC